MPGVKRRILIISASIGAGHNQAANAIQAAWKMKFPHDDIHIIDFMADCNSHFNHFVKKTYLKTIAISPDLYELVYRWTQGAGTGAKVQDLLSWTMRKSMARIIRQYHPHLVICTHPFPCGAIAYLKRKRKVGVPVAGIITDFAVHSLWINHEVDQYIVASAELKADLMRQGIAPSRVFATGIPIHPCFARQRDKSSVRHPLDGKFNPVILIMGGGLGMGPMRNLLTGLNQVALPVKIIAVTGQNAALRETLQAMAVESPHDVSVLGYTEHVCRLMRTADILITKPGALTISEALAVELPMLFFAAIPGQERDNANFVISKGAARWLTHNEGNPGADGGNISRQITGLLADAGELTQWRVAAQRIGHPQSALLAVTALHRILERKLLASGI